MKKIYLVRHGQSTSNAGGDAQPNADIELTDLGYEQAQAVSEWLVESLGDMVNTIKVSKFIRTQQTAQPYLNCMNRTATIMDTLFEFDYVSFAETEGTSLDFRVDEANDFWLDNTPEQTHGDDSESYQHFYDRVAQALKDFNTLPAGNHIMFTHGLWISMLIWQILGQPSYSNLHMRKFRQFEMAIRAKNTEVFCLTLNDNQPPAITKVRHIKDDSETIEYR